MTMNPDKEAVEVEIEFAGVTESDGIRLADHFEQTTGVLAQHLTLLLNDRLSGPVTKTTLGRAFLADSGSVNTVPGKGATLVLSAPRARLVTPLTGTELNDAFAEFARTRTAIISPDLAAAREMFYVAMQTEHLVGRFLVLYSALMLLATFKGHRRFGWQKKVDELLLDEDQTIREVTTARGTETIYTEARNRLVHADERDRDPAAASRDIERLTPDFQRLVARILVKG